MPLAGSLTANLNIQITYPGGASKSFNVTFLSSVSPGGESIDLQSGDNVIPYPSTAVGAILVPPVGNAVLVSVRNAGGGNGPSLHPTNPAVVSRHASQVNLVLNAGGTIAGYQVTFI